MPRDRDSDSDGDFSSERRQRRGKLIQMSGYQAVERALDEFARADSASPHYAKLVSETVSLGRQLLAAVTRRLDSSQPESLCSLSALVAAYPARAEAVHALLRAAFDRRNGDYRRLGAMLLANSYFGLPLTEDFVTSLRSPANAVAYSLLGLLSNCASNPDLRRAHVAALLSQPPELLYAALDVLAAAGGTSAFPALRLFALYPDPELQQSAISAIAGEGSSESMRTLTILQPNLPPEQDRLVSRLLRKGRLSGAYLEEPAAPPTGRRALLSAIDGRGNRVLWLVVPGSGAGGAEKRIALSLKETVGLGEVAGGQRGHPFPAAVPEGTLHPPLQPPFEPRNFATASCIEAPYGYGLRMLRAAVQRTWTAGYTLPVEYELNLDSIWDAAPRDGADSYAQEVEGLAHPVSPDEESALLANPLFGSWYLESGALYMAAQDLLAQDIGLPTTLTDESWRALLPVVIKLARSEFGAEMRRAYSERLELMAEWFAMSGQRRNARLAASAAKTMLDSPPEANLFVISLVEKGILVALENLATGHGWLI